MMESIVTFLIIPVYKVINLIDSVIAQIHGPENVEGLPSKKNMRSKMTHGNNVVSGNFLGPETLGDAKKPLIKENSRNPSKSIEAMGRRHGRYVFIPQYASFRVPTYDQSLYRSRRRIMRSFKRPTTCRVNRPVKINPAITVKTDISAPKEKIVRKTRTNLARGSIKINLSITTKKDVLPTKEKTAKETTVGVNPAQKKPMDDGKNVQNESFVIVEPKASSENWELCANLSNVKLYQPLDCKVMVPLSHKRVTSLPDLLKVAPSTLLKHHEDIAGRGISSNAMILASPMSKPVGSATNVLRDFAPFQVFNPRRSLANADSNFELSDLVGREPFMQHTAVSSVMSNAIGVSLEGRLRHFTFRPLSNRHRSLGDVITMPVSRSVHREIFLQNIVLSPAMSKALSNLLEGFSRGSIPTPVIKVSRRTSRVDSKIHGTISFNYRGFIIDLEPSVWKIFEGMLNSISQKRPVISSTTNLTKQLGCVSSLISHPLELKPQYPGPEYDAPQFVVPSIKFSSVIFPQRLIATAPSFPLSISTISGNIGDKIPHALDLETTQLELRCTKKHITSPVNVLGLDVPAPSILTPSPSPFVPISGASFSLSEHSCSEQHDKVLESMILQTDQSDMNILQPSNLETSVLLPIVGTPLILGPEPTVLATHFEAPKCIAPLIDISGMRTVRSSYLATSSSIPPLVLEILDNVSSQASSPRETEPANLATQYKTSNGDVSSITLSPGDVPASFPSTTSFILRAFAQTAREKPSKDLMAPSNPSRKTRIASPEAQRDQSSSQEGDVASAETLGS